MKNNILFLYLTAFSQTGGIEKFNCAFCKALGEINTSGKTTVYSLYDRHPDLRYLSEKTVFNGFCSKYLAFIFKSLIAAIRCNLIILGHINLAPVGFLIKVLMPWKKILLITHGIEVWIPLKGLKKLVLQQISMILSVSNFTKQKLICIQGAKSNKIKIFHNTLDPYFLPPSSFVKPEYLLDKYFIKPTDKIILTIARLNYQERYKGYDKVIEALSQIKKEQKEFQFKYIIGGKADSKEKERLTNLIHNQDLDKHVHLCNFIPEEELIDHYLLSDIFAMPSKGEGFGIVLIEAAGCGNVVVAGNQDGSKEALKEGELGTLINPDSIEDIKSSILNAKLGFNREVQEKTLAYYSFYSFTNSLRKILKEV